MFYFASPGRHPVRERSATRSGIADRDSPVKPREFYLWSAWSAIRRRTSPYEAAPRCANTRGPAPHGVNTATRTHHPARSERLGTDSVVTPGVTSDATKQHPAATGNRHHQRAKSAANARLPGTTRRRQAPTGTTEADIYEVFTFGRLRGLLMGGLVLATG